ncbi:glycosyltransferase family 1 protein [Paenibacillus sp. BR2-3]|uniref:glycosyltransferase family 4 protein n=1 Tax=Paenibacillus sp. BR2-3 TaxID=3048494 RepID=UPI003977AE35
MLKVIYDNIIFNLQRSGGISVYWKELIERLMSECSIDVDFIEYSGAEKNIFRKQVKISKNNIRLKSNFPNINFLRYINLSKNNDEQTIFHSSYYRTMKGKNIINVVTVHDFTYEKKINTNIGKIHVHQKKKALKNADGIICISENTKKDMIELYPELKNKNIKVIYNGFNGHDYYPIPEIEFENSVIFVGSRKGYKNFNEVVEIISNLENISLKIVGAQLDQEEVSLLKQKLPNRYTLYKHINNEYLNVLYNKSICLVYLSEYEGFGIPVLEAMSAGCPVIALNKSSIPEVAREAGLLFDKIDYESIRNTILDLRENKEFRETQVKNGQKNSKRFSWDKCYHEVLGYYQELARS